MKATILITAENKENFLIDTIESCLKQTYKNVEIILLFTYLKNLELLKKKFKKKIIFKKVYYKIQNPVKDQFHKISEGLKFANGEFIFLLDGDDLFKSNKVRKLIKLGKKNKIFIDDYIILENKKYKYQKNNKFKKNFIFKYFINPWPDKICTSCISGRKEMFKNFFKRNNHNMFNFLAVDILITIFYLHNISKIKDILTIKRQLKISVDKNYSNIFKQTYWKRRIEQHTYLKKVQSINYSMEFYLSKFISYLFDFHKYIQRIF